MPPKRKRSSLARSTKRRKQCLPSGQIVKELSTRYYKRPISLEPLPEGGDIGSWLKQNVPHPHVYYEQKASFKQGNKAIKADKSMIPRVDVSVDYPTKTFTIALGTFVGIFGRKYSGPKHERSYIKEAQQALKLYRVGVPGYELVIDLRNNQGGDDKVMRRALKGIDKSPPGKVLVSEQTFSAGEMIAADLIFDFGFTKVGPQTGGGLTKTKNMTLCDGSFFMFPVSMYRTPKGHVVDTEYL